MVALSDLPTISSGYSAQVHESQSYNYNSHTPRPQSHQTTSLPSFASFQEHANRIDDAEEVEIAPMSARLSCYLCTKLKPLVRDVAIAVAEIDENVQSYCNMSVTRVRCHHPTDVALPLICLKLLTFYRRLTFLKTAPSGLYNGFLTGSSMPKATCR